MKLFALIRGNKGMVFKLDFDLRN
ncbi:protein of unknown function [Maridesulfovibrio hydrothermalis AM13 = DSM 14728]|uniref:Uncharacterized protein n=1 Tax=Maridesulfovibrio hydrothermalis AM13 = DSM 14728 TaxID=1121451 RepID=L0R7K2_9BACT|nr:protein of unknown function [Maridesulfovibrio hydrothermalis AM13 = DSM 14728]